MQKLTVGPLVTTWHPAGSGGDTLHHVISMSADDWEAVKAELDQARTTIAEQNAMLGGLAFDDDDARFQLKQARAENGRLRAALAAEREACAAICDERVRLHRCSSTHQNRPRSDEIREIEAERCAYLIRARGD